MSFKRKKLTIEVRDKLLDIDAKASEILYQLILTTYPPNTVDIVYWMTKQDSVDAVGYLFGCRLSAHFYYVDWSATDPHMVRGTWQNGQLIIACTSRRDSEIAFISMHHVLQSARCVQVSQYPLHALEEHDRDDNFRAWRSFHSWPSTARTIRPVVVSSLSRTLADSASAQSVIQRVTTVGAPSASLTQAAVRAN